LEDIQMMIPAYLMSVGYLGKQDLKGSYKGMCYRLHAEFPEEKGQQGTLRVWCWPQPLCFDTVPQEQKQEKAFTFDAEGIKEAGDWLEDRYNAGEWVARNYLRRG
jgi:hypothetical protein